MGMVIQAQNDWREVGWPEVTMHRNCHIFCSLFLSAALKEAFITQS